MAKFNLSWEEPMFAWAAGVALALGAGAWLAPDPMAVLSSAAEIAAVVAVFALVCATEAWN